LLYILFSIYNYNKICILIVNTALIALISTLYVIRLSEINELYLVWICAIFFSHCGIYVLIPTITAKSFGQKHFTTIYGFMLLCGVTSHLDHSPNINLIIIIFFFLFNLDTKRFDFFHAVFYNTFNRLVRIFSVWMLLFVYLWGFIINFILFN
jgi:hypothetical protein